MKGFVFDLDNTLFDRYATITKVITDNFSHIKQYINPAYNAEEAAAHLCNAECVYLADGPSWTRIYETLKAEHFFNKDNLPDKERCFNFILRNFEKTAVNFPFTEELLLGLRKKGYKLAIITNGKNYLQQQKINILGIRHLFDAIISSGEFAVLMCGDEDNRDWYKPNSHIFEYMAQILKEKPENLYYVGDNPVNDVIASKNAGYKPIWVKSRSPWPLDISQMPEICIKTIEELNNLV